ncbi:MBL fold metallo-hydrolase [Rhizobium mayense]|uniref:Metallo-beta-lactamase domain-containing protein n=1 Tax=Rhizobium mayense TaxID=1312184 RepID=A0ABT7K3C2_9HYPH|nr:MBL fold metallo-hydrolase [Rhizobium mayense]MDL2403111.1 hypothetical protein [Rhizobium mayense]
MPTRKNSAPAAATAANPDFRVRIRMYRHGLGDCFLLSFPKGQEKHLHMLIDCGVVLGTGEPGSVMRQVAQNVKDATGGVLDVVVITHEHWDHLSGFDEKQARGLFDTMEIKELWLAWTEDETDDLATSLREERQRKMEAVKAAKEAAKKNNLDQQVARMSELLGFFGAAAAGAPGGEDEDAGGTGGALQFLKNKRSPTIMKTGTSILLDGVDDVRVFVVGPPRDDDAMRKTNPSKGEGYGLSDPPIGLAEAFLAAFSPGDESAQPFHSSLGRELDELKKHAENRKKQATAARRKKSPDGSLIEDPLLPGIEGYYHEEFAWRSIDNAWLATGERLALQLDSATNNTSLVLAIELGGKDVLLFVGDAQAGNWRSWESCTWTVKDKNDEFRSVTAADLLNRTIFYKVGHHGSHNATMKTKGLELMKSNRLAAFIPVDTKVAHEVKGWEHMPLPAIRTRLEERCAVIFQSDMETLSKKPVPFRWEDSSEQFDVRMRDKVTKKIATVRTQPLYTDYFV